MVNLLHLKNNLCKIYFPYATSGEFSKWIFCENLLYKGLKASNIKGCSGLKVIKLLNYRQSFIPDIFKKKSYGTFKLFIDE